MILPSPASTVVNKYRPSESVKKFTTFISEVVNVITPLLPPEPFEMLTFPCHIFSNKSKFALCDSCMNIIAVFCLIAFLIRPIACKSLMLFVKPLQFIVMNLIEFMSGPGLLSIPARFKSIRIKLMVAYSLNRCLFTLIRSPILKQSLNMLKLSFLFTGVKRRI